MIKSAVHIGLGKTGTTTLQDKLFYELNNKDIINYLGKVQVEKNQHLYNFSSNLLKYLSGKSTNKPDLNFTANQLNVISEEGFLSPLLNLSTYSANKNETAFPIKKTLLELKKLLQQKTDQIKILLTLRRQDSYLFSFYTHNFVKFFSKKDISFNKFINLLTSENRPPFLDQLDYLMRYDKLTHDLKNIFGEKNIKIIFFEDLNFDKDKFISDIANFLEISPKEVATLMANHSLNTKEKKGTQLLFRQDTKDVL